MRFILCIFVVMCNFSCGKKDDSTNTTLSKTHNSFNTTLSEPISTNPKQSLCPPEFVDGSFLGPPSSFPDEMTKRTILKVKNSPKALNLAIGVSNINKEVQRFKNDCDSWVFLDINGVENGPDFLHIDLRQLETLTKLADEIGEKFTLIAIDFSVTRLVRNFSFQSIFEIMRMLKKNGTLHLWYDERPFANDIELKKPSQFKDIIADIDKKIAILNRAINLPQLSTKFFGPIEIYHSLRYRFFGELPTADEKTLNAKLEEHSEKKAAVLKKLFLLENIQFELKRNGFPLPTGAFDFSQLPYVMLTKL